MYPEFVNLDGLWDFFYSSVKFDPLNDKLPDIRLFTGKMVTPGYWDDHLELFDEEDFFGLTAKFNPDYRKPHFPMGRSLTPHASSSFLIGTGFYHRKFKSKNIHAGQRVEINIGPAMWGCSCFINGTLSGSVSGYSVATSFDLTEHFKYGEENDIIIVVDNVRNDGGAYCNVDGSHAGITFGTRPGQHRGLAAQGYQSERAGIGGGVQLKVCRGMACIADYFLSSENSKTVWHITFENAAGKTVSYSMKYKRKLIAGGSFEVAGNEAVFETAAPDQLWSDITPALCDIEIVLYDESKVCDRAAFKWGKVNVTTQGTKLLVNGKATYFRGATEHCYFPETTNPHFDKAKYIHDLGVLKAAGFNFIRCHTWCPPEPFYDACDELGIFVQTEFPSVYTFDEVRDILRMIRRHTCAVLVCEGNEKYIDENGIARLREVCRIAKEMMPNVLFNPQEAIRGVEYGFVSGQKTEKYPFEHDAKRFAAISEFSDVYGSLGGGYFSYDHAGFPGVEKIEDMHSIYRKPCLSHEIGILGGYLDFSLEERYRNTFIGTDMFEAARQNMQRHGVWQNAEMYYRHNCRFISSVRKQLIENIRSCRSIAGYDYLGGIDTHWHLIGYPCGMFNEFYEEKYAETAEDIAIYNGESLLLSERGKFRNITAGKRFENTILLSYYGRNVTEKSSLNWQLRQGKNIIVSDAETFDVPESGTVTAIAAVSMDIPDFDRGEMLELHVSCSIDGKVLRNSWKFWAFPEPQKIISEKVRCVTALTADDVRFMEQGGSVLLTGNFPCSVMSEKFGPHTSGRSIGHSGTVIHDHTIWKNFPHDGFADWQFYEMFCNSTSLITVNGEPEFAPLIELIPSFKLIKRKSMLSEYRVKNGRLMLCGLRLDVDDPGAKWMKYTLTEYLVSPSAEVPEWDPEKLLSALNCEQKLQSSGQKMDAGGRPVE